MGFHNINILLSQHQTHWLQPCSGETAWALSVHLYCGMEGLTGQIKVEFCWNPSSRYQRDSIQFLSMEGKCLTVSIHFFHLLKNYEHCKRCLKIELHTLLLRFYFSTVLFPDNVWIGKYPHRSSQALSRVPHLYFTWDIHTDILTTIKAHFSILYKLVIMTPSMIAWLAQLLPYGRHCDYFLEYCNYLKQMFQYYMNNI